MGGRPDAESNHGPHVGWLRTGPGRPWEELVPRPDLPELLAGPTRPSWPEARC